MDLMEVQRMDKESREEMLWKIYENLIRTEERLKALNETNTLEHDTIKIEIVKITKKYEELEARLDKVEHRGIALSTTWKITLFLFGAIPTIITILDLIGVI